MPFVLLPRPVVIGAFAIATLAAACADDTTVAGDNAGEADAPITLVGRTFWSTAVTDGDEPFELVDGTRIQLRFSADEISADAGCNNLFTAYTLDGDTIVAEGGGMTEMGCDPERHAQDDFVIGFLTSRPTYQLSGDTLSLTNASGQTIELLDKEVADPDRTIDGQAWEVTGFFDETAAWSTAVASPATLDFRGGLLSGTSGCGPIPVDLTFDLQPDRLVLTGEVDMPEWCGDADELTKEYADTLASVLASGQLAFAIDGPNLRLTGPDGLGVTATAIDESA